jgi:FtsP/CotA-like multicopper oxidase with cupredoxin domain
MTPKYRSIILGVAVCAAMLARSAASAIETRATTVQHGVRRREIQPGEDQTARIWLFHCHISDHMAGGMVTRYKVNR